MNVLVVGSSVIDLFLDVDRHHVNLTNQTAIFHLGDKIPSRIKAFAVGGNGANVSVGLTRLEIPTTFYTYLANDVLSRQVQEKLSREGVEVVADKRGGNTPLHIIVDFSSDRLIFSHYEKHEHAFGYSKPTSFDYIYLTSIADIWENAYRQVLHYAKRNNIPIAFSPGSRQLENVSGLFHDTVRHSKIFFSNKDEAMKISNFTHSASSGQEFQISKNEQENNEQMKLLLKAINKLGPSVVSITDGENGSYGMDKTGIYKIGILNIKSVERTGAGDSYATAFLAAFIHGEKIETCMKQGVLNASSVMQQIGAQKGLLSKKHLDDQLKSADNLTAVKL